jgi:hypothetical protein
MLPTTLSWGGAPPPAAVWEETKGQVPSRNLIAFFSHNHI